MAAAATVTLSAKERGEQLKRENIVFVSGIGCSSKTPDYFLGNSHGFNTVHGRMPSVLTGANLAGAVEVAAVHTSANAALIAGYGYAGILVAFMARHNPLAIIPVAILFGGFGAAGSLLQRRLGLPDASVLVLQGIAFVLILASEALRDTDWKAAWGRLVRAAAPGTGPSPAQAGMGDKLT
jgi:hypothetical protein